MAPPITIRTIEPGDRPGWRPLWDGYNAFYGRSGCTALPDAITAATWSRFFDTAEPVHALVALQGERIVGWRTPSTSARPPGWRMCGI